MRFHFVNFNLLLIVYMSACQEFIEEQLHYLQSSIASIMFIYKNIYLLQPRQVHCSKDLYSSDLRVKLTMIMQNEIKTCLQ